MHIAVHAADLDHARTDGTRVYIKEVLSRLGACAPQEDVTLYHRHVFAPHHAPTQFPRYRERRVSAPFLWTQTRFAAELYRASADVVWMPVQSAPYLAPPRIPIVVTIHDVAFRRFPQMFPRQDVFSLNILTSLALRRARHVIAVSETTREDILRYYPFVDPQRVHVIHHGYTPMREVSSRLRDRVLSQYGIIATSPYILYVGAMQPRKNLARLVDAFTRIAHRIPDVQLVLAGADGWMAQATHDAVHRSAARHRIIRTGALPFAHVRALYAAAHAVAFPSLYEGFGLPILEAFSADVPVLAARSGGIVDVVAADTPSCAALLCDPYDVDDMAAALERVVTDSELRARLVERGRQRLMKFSWETCTEQTLQVLRTAAQEC